MNKYYYCYSYPLKEFLINNDVIPIMNSVHKKTNKTFWVFEKNNQLDKYLSEWQLRK